MRWAKFADGMPKAMLPFGPENLLQRVVRLLSEVTDPVVVVAAPDQTLPSLPRGVLIAHDRLAHGGPLEGINEGLKRIAPLAGAAYVSACDVPFLRASFVMKMCGFLDQHDNAVAMVGVATALATPKVGRVMLLSIVSPAEDWQSEKTPRSLEASQSVVREALTASFARGLAPQALTTVSADPWSEIARVVRVHRCESLLLGLSNLTKPGLEGRLEALMGQVSCDVAILRAPPGWLLRNVRSVLVPLGGRGGHDVLRTRLLASIHRLGVRETTLLRVAARTEQHPEQDEPEHGHDGHEVAQHDRDDRADDHRRDEQQPRQPSAHRYLPAGAGRRSAWFRSVTLTGPLRGIDWKSAHGPARSRHLIIPRDPRRSRTEPARPGR